MTDSTNGRSSSTIQPPKGLEGVTNALPTLYQRIVGRIRAPLIWALIVLIIIDEFVVELPGWLTFASAIVVLAFYFLLGTPKSKPLVIGPPIAGRWEAANSPASRVPSHRLHAYGQTYAIDLTHHPRDGERPDSGAVWPLAHRPEAYAAFGQPVLAPIHGTVVKTHETARDHWSRTSMIAVPYLLVEATARELFGMGRILGNHVVIDDGEGAFALVAHLRQDSVRVEEGEEVEAGQLIAQCGNSGNSTEPHVHVQMMDRRQPYLACGLPFVFESDQLEADHDGVPLNGEAIVSKVSHQ